MDKLNSFLFEWALSFIKNRDLFAKNILSIAQKKDESEFIVEFKTKKQVFIILPSIENINLVVDKIEKNKKENISIICFNTKENFMSLLNNWDKLIKFEKLNIYFTNPFSSLEKKWIIYPFTHNKISDSSSLDSGLKTIFQTVEKTTLKEIEKTFDS